MRIGIQLPQWGRAASREAILRIARLAETAGFDSVWASDHVVYPLDAPADYPYNVDRTPPFTPEDGYLEVLTTLAVVAGATERIRLGTSVLILPMRNILLTAKVVSTLDVLSSGRVTLALSAGWWQGEFEALGQNFEQRGPRFDEQLVVLRDLWTNGRAAAEGKNVNFSTVVSEPKPIQPGGPDLWIGGRGKRVWARIARSNVRGWHGIGHDRESIGSAQVAIAAACTEHKRDFSTVGFSTATGMPTTAEKILSRIGALTTANVDQVVFIPRGDDLDSILGSIDLFGSSVKPKLS